MSVTMNLQDVSLDYLIKTGSSSLKQTVFHLCNGVLGRNMKQKKTLIKNDSFRALDGINLQANKGDRIGLIGKNGAGKSSLLRVMARIYSPSSGHLEINGKISSLFDINLGFNTEATGYENIINLGIMRGWNREQAHSVVGEIEQFTELNHFLDKPVRTYSSGMQMKLAFAVATSTVSDILLIDEIIGVGDAQFMEKARQRIMNLVNQVHILVLTSHSTEVIERFCNKVIVMDSGKIKYIGDCQSGIKFYEEMIATPSELLSA
ncbi:MAG: ABC transporter ATP-binding protein [Gammaproteobacteria bacterium]|nr:ABC transporter ATP-binding protein [Gammaproteobacteria bacterium]MCH9715493.1 ABC transporter ATP-binding protein [Gammaproteobacteria bacterium]MCH9763382.1 ABC transporter ATP-binding protein [Gammaproteobacteria bacterium]